MYELFSATFVSISLLWSLLCVSYKLVTWFFNYAIWFSNLLFSAYSILLRLETSMYLISILWRAYKLPMRSRSFLFFVCLSDSISMCNSVSFFSKSLIWLYSERYNVCVCTVVVLTKLLLVDLLMYFSIFYMRFWYGFSMRYVTFL